MPKPGDIVGGYRLIARIDSGGQGQVFAASKGEGTEEVAVKLIKALRPKKRARFVQEIRAHAALASQQAPNIIPILDHNLEELEEGGVPGYIAMPKAKHSLEDASAKQVLQGRLEVCLEVFEGVVRGVAAAHNAGIIHRDIKPGNVLFLEPGLRTPYVSDFGICFVKESGKDRLTEAGETVGAKYFMAPEQERGGVVDITPAADVYSLGKLLYHMISGRLLFREELEGAFSTVDLVQDPRLETVMRDVLSRTIVKAPSDRIQNAEELLGIVRHLRATLFGTRSGSEGPSSLGNSGPDGEVRPAGSSLAGTYRRYCTMLAEGKDRLVALDLDARNTEFLGVWERLHGSVEHAPQRSIEAAEQLIEHQPAMTALAFAIARSDALVLFLPFKRFLEFITRASEKKAGYPRIFTIPHLQAGYLYMGAAVLALHHESWDVFSALLTEKFEWYYQSGRPLYSEGFLHSYFFHAEAIGRESSKSHDFFRKQLSNEHVAAATGLSGETLLDEYLKCQLLMSLRAAQLSEAGEERGLWPDFGRFHEYRVVPLFDRIHSDPGYAAGVLRAFRETSTEFLERVDARLQLVVSWFRGGDYFWDSITSWEPR